jgi:hypothetical protein
VAELADALDLGTFKGGLYKLSGCNALRRNRFLFQRDARLDN